MVIRTSMIRICGVLGSTPYVRLVFFNTTIQQRFYLADVEETALYYPDISPQLSGTSTGSLSDLHSLTVANNLQY